MSKPNTEYEGEEENDVEKLQKEGSVATFEEALSMTGFGKYHWILLFMSGLVYFSFAYQNIISAYLGPAAECDLNMASEDKGILNAIFILGGMTGAIPWGILADHYGRRIILVISLFMDTVLTIASTFSQSLGVLLAFRFLNGAVMVAPGSVILTYLVESMATKYRSRCVVFMGVFVTMSYVVLPLVALAVLPIEWSYEVEGFKYNSWRLYLLTAVIPSIVPALIFQFVYPESPKFLYSQGKTAEALGVLRKMYEFNFPKDETAFQVRSFCSEPIPQGRSSVLVDPETLTKNQEPKERNLMDLVSEMGQQATEILKPPHIWPSLLANGLMFTALFGYYGLGLWIPELTDRFEKYYKTSNVSVTTCELTYLWNDYDDETSQACQNSRDVGAYINTFIMGIVCAVGNVIFSLVEKKFGLRSLSVFTLLASASSALGVYFVSAQITNLVVSCIFLTVAEAASMIIQSATSELFPTRIRGLAMCVAWLCGRAGAVSSNILIGYLIDTICEVPVFLMAAALFVGTFLAFFLPAQRAVDEKFQASLEKDDSLPAD